MKQMSITILVFSFFLFGCSNTSNEESKQQIETISHEGDRQRGEKEIINLDNDEKWLVNNEMKPYILESENILKDYEETKSKDYRELAERLKEMNSGLIKNCTMEGESHDQLHKWLHPHMELIEKLDKASSSKEANEIISQLKESFKTYKQYFK